MISAFGVDHGEISKLYTEERVATPSEEKAYGSRRPKKPGRIKRTLLPRAAKRQEHRATAPQFASKTDEWGKTQAPLVQYGQWGPRGAKQVKRFSSHVGGETG